MTYVLKERRPEYPLGAIRGLRFQQSSVAILWVVWGDKIGIVVTEREKVR